MERNNIPKKRSRDSEINNDALKEKIQEISRNSPNFGILEIVSHLIAANPLWLFKEVALENYYQQLTELGVLIDGRK